MVVYAKAGKAVLGVLGDVGDVAQNFLKSLGKKSGTPPVKEFSPSLKAAEALKQEKGPYEQLKATMINKHGAKEAEMDWSGTNDRFAGKTVTKTELVDYLSGRSTNYDPTDLIKTDTNVAKGKMSSTDYELEAELEKEAVENYIDRTTPELLADEKDEFFADWPVSNYLNFKNSEMQSVEDLIILTKNGDIGKGVLDDLAENIIGIEDGAELAKRFPEGYVLPDPDGGPSGLFGDRIEAAGYDWDFHKNDKEIEIRKRLEEKIELMQIDYDDREKLFQTLYPVGIKAPPETVSPDALTYTSENFPLGGTDTAETVYRFDDPTGLYNDVVGTGNIDIHKFDELPEDNILAHTRTAQFPVVDGGKGYHLGEVQSDIYQNQRRVTKLGREPSEELRSRSEELALREKFDSIDEKTLMSEIVSLTDKTDKMYDDIIANLRTKVGMDADRKLFEPRIQDEVYTLKLELAEKQRQLGDIKPSETISKQIQNALDELEGDINNYYIEVQKADDLYRLQDKLEVYNMENTTDQFKQLPYGESTNQWVDMVLRKELAKAIDSGSEFMTIPSSDLVRKYTSGLEEGQGKFYFTESELGIVPKRLNKLGKKYDPNISLIPRKIITEAGDENVMALPITQKLIDNIMNKGLPKYAVPITGGSLGALSFVEGEQQ